ncbi:MAG: hypothetical protein H0T46_00565 [Deltaproteobacteria bacterium]|nr:hypothetical protein [Deltaproteobacteria bacterium]
MFGLFQNTTPAYAGSGQPTARCEAQGAFGFLTNLLAPATPTYQTARPDGTAGAKAPAAASEATSVPMVTEPALQPDCRVPLPIAILIQRPE